MQPTVLIVDDDDDLRQLYATALSNRGHRILLAGNGQEALKAVSDAHPDAMVLDLNLPDMTGKAVLERIVKKFNAGFPYLPQVIFNTGADDLPEQERRSIAGNVSAKIEGILRDQPSVAYDFSRLVCSVQRKSGVHELGLAVRDALDSPKARLVQDVKNLLWELDDSPEDARYRSQLESFLHEFHMLHLKFRAIADDGYTRTDQNADHNALFARTLVMGAMPTLRGHSRDTADYAVRIGRMMGIKGDDIDRLRYASYYHDMGQLPAREFYSSQDVFKEDDRRRKFLPFHPRVSRMLLETLGVQDKDVLSLVESHHANYDGSGYPACRRDDIPLHGILRIAETMDSVKRQMQHIHGEEKARLEKPTVDHIVKELSRYKGTLFNPTAADKALQYLGQA